MESTSKTQRRGKHNKSKFIWRFKPKSQNMQSITMTKNLAFKLKILIENQTQSIKTSKSIDLEKKKCAPIYVGLWPSTTNHSHSKPITTDRNLTTPNPHHITSTRPRKRTQTLQSRSTTSPLYGAVARPRERERIRTPMPIHTKIHEPPPTRTMVSTQRPCEREERDEWLRRGRDKRVREKTETREFLDQERD